MNQNDTAKINQEISQSFNETADFLNELMRKREKLLEHKKHLEKEIASWQMIVDAEHQIYQRNDTLMGKHVYKESQANAYAWIARCRKAIEDIDKELGLK